MSEEADLIKNRKRMKQIHSFNGMQRMRNITPTDIDGLIDYGGCAFVYLEGKLQNAKFMDGQKKALEAVVRSHWRAGHKSMAIVYEHNSPANEEILVCAQFVKAIFCLEQIRELMRVPHENSKPKFSLNETWFYPQRETTNVLEAIDMFEKHFNIR